MKSLINRIWSMASVDSHVADKTAAIQDKAASIELTVAVMLVNAAMINGNLEDSQRTEILSMLKEKFHLSEAGAARLFQSARIRLRKPISLYEMSRKLAERMEIDERLQLMAMVRRVVYADGVLDAAEAQLLTQMGSLLHIRERDIGTVRAKIQAMLGRTHEGVVIHWPEHKPEQQNQTAQPLPQMRSLPMAGANHTHHDRVLVNGVAINVHDQGPAHDHTLTRHD